MELHPHCLNYEYRSTVIRTHSVLLINGRDLYSTFIHKRCTIDASHSPILTHQQCLAAMQGTNQLISGRLGVLLKDTSTHPGWDRTGNPPTARWLLLPSEPSHPHDTNNTVYASELSSYITNPHAYTHNYSLLSPVWGSIPRQGKLTGPGIMRCLVNNTFSVTMSGIWQTLLSRVTYIKVHTHDQGSMWSCSSI